MKAPKKIPLDGSTQQYHQRTHIRTGSRNITSISTIAAVGVLCFKLVIERVFLREKNQDLQSELHKQLIPKEKKSFIASPLIDFLQRIRDNPRIVEKKTTNHNSESLTPLEMRFVTLGEYLDNSPMPNLPVLDEYFTVAAQFYQQEAQKGDEDLERASKVSQSFQKLQTGSNQEKRIFCTARRRRFLNLTRQQESEENRELAAQSHIKAENWQKRARVLRLMTRR